MNVILEPNKMNRIAYKLREESEDYYLFFLCMYKTGYTGSRLLCYKSEEIEGFIEETREFLGPTLIEELQIHNISKTVGEPFFCNKYSISPLPRRTIEYWFKQTAKDLLNIDGFGFKTVTKTFYYEYFRKNDYNFNTVKKLFSSRRQYMADLEAFLDYCGLTFEEYQADRLQTYDIQTSDYLANLKSIIDILFSLASNPTLSLSQKTSLERVTKEILVQLEPFSGF